MRCIQSLLRPLFALATFFSLGFALPASHAARCGFNADTVGTESAANALSDGVLMLRHTLGLSGSALIAKTSAANASSSAIATSDHVKEHFRFHRPGHDLDGDAIVDAIDAQLAIRYLLGYRGAALTQGLAVRGRRDANAIAAYIESGCSTAPPPLPDPVANVIYVSTTGTDLQTGGAQAAPLRTLAYACARAQAGDTIRLSAGTFQETLQCVAKSGVRIMGNGRDGANKTIVIAPLAWNFTADNTTDKPEGYSVLLSNVQNVTVDQVEFRGNANKANGAIRVVNSNNTLLRDLAIYDYRYTGLNISGEDKSPSSRIDAQNIYLENSGYEWLPGVSTQFPSGGSVGNLGISNVDDSVFAFVSIKTTSRRGYGAKVGNLKRSRFIYSQFEMFPEQSWNGGGPGNFDMELFGSHEKVELAHNKFRQTVSLISFPNENYESIPYSVHVHHNDFRLGPYAYALETEGSKFVVDHNWFANTWTAMQRFGEPPETATALSRNVTVFNNVVDGLDSRLVGLKGRVESLRVFNNTAYLGPGGIAQNYLITVGSSNRSSRWLVGNNVIVGSANKPADSRYFVTAYQTDEAPRDVLFSNNVYKDIAAGVSIDNATHNVADPATWDHRYSSNLNADPVLPQSGANAYEPTASSPVVDAGNNDIGVRRAYTGGARDVGAFERGQPTWQYGLGSVSDIEYLWAPTTSIRDEFFIGSVSVDLNAQPGTQIRYTLDGTEPGWNSTLYTAPINVTGAVKLRARAFNEHFASGPALMLNLAPSVRGYPNLALGLPDSAYTASSTYFQNDPQGNPIYVPKRAFDDEYVTFLGWSPNVGDARPWVQVDLGAAKRIRFIEFFTRQSVDQPDSRRNFEIRASNDPTFATYAVLYTQGATTLAHQAVVEQEIVNANTFRYVRATKTIDEGFFVNELKIRGE
jgi:Chitobiase/beta-hexosaminidase C-terminal domain/F5/8 type C domain/Protein of unknown function (DUF1565)